MIKKRLKRLEGLKRLKRLEGLKGTKGLSVQSYVWRLFFDGKYSMVNTLEIPH